MFRNKKKILGIVICLIFIITIGLNSSYSVNAKTNETVKQSIARIKKEIQQLKNNYNAEQRKYDAQVKGCDPLLFSKAISYNPYIVSMYNFFTGSTTYYWIKNAGNIDLLGNGWVRPTGRYLIYNGITCTECNAVKVTASPSKIGKKIEQKKEQLKKYEIKLKNTATLDDMLIVLGQSKKVSKYWKYEYEANKLTYKSLDTKVAIVDGVGKVTAKKIGRTVIVATDTANGKQYKCTVKVGKPIKTLNFEHKIYVDYYSNLEDAERYDYPDGRIIWLYLKADTKIIADKIKISIDDTDVAESLREDFVLSDGKAVPILVKREGIFNVTAKTTSGLRADCDVNVYGVKVKNIKLEQPEIKVAIDSASAVKEAFDLPISVDTAFDDYYEKLDDFDDFDDYYDYSKAGMPLISNSSNEEVLDVTDITIFPKKVGESVVTVETFDGKKVSCKVIVVDRVGNEELYNSQKRSKYRWN